MSDVIEDARKRLENADTAQKPEAFAAYCSAVIEAVSRGTYTRDEALGMMSANNSDAASAGAEMSQVEDIIFDLIEEYPSDEKIRDKMWVSLKRITKRYAAGKRRPTYYVLMVHYDEVANGKIVGGTSARLRRHGNGVRVFAGDAMVHDALLLSSKKAVLRAGDAEVTVLQKMQDVLPRKIGNYTLRDEDQDLVELLK